MTIEEKTTTGNTNNSPHIGGAGRGSLHSRYFTLAELTRSATAKQLNLDNAPTPEVVASLQALVTHVLDPLRQLCGQPIYVSSGYRSPELNAAVRGATNSQHMKGEAADITTGTRDGDRRLLGIALKEADTLKFDQLIAERCDRNGRPKWLHISFGARSRRQVLYD